MRSMTGYAESKIIEDHLCINMTLQSVNRKQLDIRFNFPEEFRIYEVDLRKVLQSLGRGAVFCKLTYTFSGTSQSFTFDEEKLHSYMTKIEEIQKKYSCVQDISVGHLLAVEGIRVNALTRVDNKKFEKLILNITKKSIQKLLKVQQQEGKAIREDLLERFTLMKNYLEEVEKLTVNSVKTYQQRLKEKLKVLENEASVDEFCLNRELIIFADRCDITEEVVRLKIHFTCFKELLENSCDNGREIDFLIQEFSREINTIGSKCQDVQISKLVVKLKTELERCREQVQNLV